MNEPNSPRSETPASRPNRNVLIAAIALLVGIFVIFSLRQTPAPTNSAVPAPAQLVPAPNANEAGMPASTASAPTTAVKQVPLVLFTLNDDALLERKMPTAMLPPASSQLATDEAARAKWLEVGGATALGALIKASPIDFPKGTQLRSVKVQDGSFMVDFNAAFNDTNFWQGSALVTGVTQSIAWTLDGVRRGLSQAITTDIAPMNVKLMADGKPLELLGELEVGSKLTPDEQALTPTAKAKLDS